MFVSSSNTKINNSLKLLEKYIKKNKYYGYDPYDGLESQMFSVPFLKSNRVFRFYFQQLFRRIPFNIRPIMCIQKGLNPVTLGLSIHAYAMLSNLFSQERDYYLTQIDRLISLLNKLSSKNYSGICWGYDFGWAARYANIPAYFPTVVATGIITNGLYEYYKISRNSEVEEILISSSRFVLNDLNRTYCRNYYCLSYSPNDKQVVFNATMKGARLLSQVYSITKERYLLDEVRNIVDFVIKYQKDDGSWTYSAKDARVWSDNHHTAYILDCLHEIIRITGDDKYKIPLTKGFKYYVDNFFFKGHIPKYYNDKLYPIDTTAGAQSVLTLTRFGDNDRACKVAAWMIKNMQSETGYFYYQKFKYYTHRTSYMRWSNAWMLVALAYLLWNNEGSI
jgi:hypothetical protein